MHNAPGRKADDVPRQFSARDRGPLEEEPSRARANRAERSARGAEGDGVNCGYLLARKEPGAGGGNKRARTAKFSVCIRARRSVT